MRGRGHRETQKGRSYGEGNETKERTKEKGKKVSRRREEKVRWRRMTTERVRARGTEEAARPLYGESG